VQDVRTTGARDASLYALAVEHLDRALCPDMGEPHVTGGRLYRKCSETLGGGFYRFLGS